MKLVMKNLIIKAPTGWTDEKAEATLKEVDFVMQEFTRYLKTRLARIDQTLELEITD